MKKFECDAATRSALNGTPDKLAWAGVLEAAVGTDGLIVCKRDPDATAANPWSTGTTYRSVGRHGAFSTKNGAITRLGALYGSTVQLAADVLTGAHVMRVQKTDGTRWFQGTLGPSAAMQRANGVPAGAEQVYDFEVDRSFTSSNGLGIKPNFTISGPQFQASGVGAASPGKLDTMPHLIEVWNWTNAASPTLSGSSVIDTRLDDFLFEDPDMALEIGDVAVYQSSQLAPLGEFDFAPTLLVVDKHNEEGNTTAMWELIVASAVSRVRTTWTTYPEMDTFNPAQHVTIPPAFKIVVKDKAGTVLKTIQMHDNTAINSKRAFGGGWTATEPMRPNYTTGMLLGARNVRPKFSSRGNKWFPGLAAEVMRPSRGHQATTAIAVEPLITGGYQGNSRNGLHNLWAMMQWPMTQAHQDPLPRDPYGVVDNQFNRSGASSEFSAWMDGWDYEPGSFSGHNWYTGPGGPRFDRGPMPSVLALWGTDQSFVRPQESVPITNMAHGWSLGYLNHSNHWSKDPRTLQLAEDNNDLFYNWDLASNYYGDSPNQTGAKNIDVRGNMREGDGPQHKDKNGQFFWMGWARDSLHSYGAAGWAALLMNSPMMTIANKWDTFWQLKRGGGLARSDYMVRAQAWLWLHYCIGWKLASKHRLGVGRDLIENMLRSHLENLYDNIYVPVFVQNEDSKFANGLRNLGQPILSDQNSTQGGGLGMYMGNVLALWKQTGLWSRMYNMNAKCKAVLDMQLRNMDKYVFDVTLDTSMENWPTVWVDLGNMASWAAVMPKNGLSDAVRNDDGSLRGSVDRDVSVHPFSTWVYVRTYYFPEIPHPRLAAAKAKWDDMLGAVAASVAAGADPATKRDRDFTYGYPGVGIWKAPASGLLGPA